MQFFKRGDIVQISEEVFNDGGELLKLGLYKPNTDYYVKKTELNNQGWINVCIHPNPKLKSIQEIEDPNNNCIWVAHMCLIENCGSDKKSLDFMIKNGQKTCPFCKSGKNLTSRKDGSVYCSNISHRFVIYNENNETIFEIEKGPVSIKGFYHKNYFDWTYHGTTKNYMGQKHKTQLIYDAVNKIDTLLNFQ
jgi:hypothetical protein